MVPTLDKPTKVTVPPGTQPDTILRVRGKACRNSAGGNTAIFICASV